MQPRRWRNNTGKYLNSDWGFLPIDGSIGRGKILVSLKDMLSGTPPPREGASDERFCPAQRTQPTAFRWQA